MYTAAIPPFGSVTAEDVTYTPAPGYPPGTDNVQEALDYLVGASPTVPSMTPTVEGIAFGETSAGRTLLGFGVDDGSNNVGLWASSVGAAQNPSNSGSSVTAFFDTETSGATMLNGVYIGAEGSVKNSVLSKSLLIQRNATIEGQADWTQDLLMLYDFTANPNDRVARSLALMTGQFSTDSNFDQSLLIGDMTGVDSAVITDALCIRTPGSTSNLTMANNTGYIGNGQQTYVMSPGDFLCETYNRYFLKTLRPDATSGQVAFYEPVSGELTYGPPPAPILSTAIISSAWFPAMYNPTTNVLAYASGYRLSRVWRGQGTTDLNGTIIFNPGGLIAVNAPNTAITATVVSTSTTIAYTCSVSNINSGTFSIQVFQSTNTVLGSASMVRAGSGLVVHVTLAY